MSASFCRRLKLMSVLCVTLSMTDVCAEFTQADREQAEQEIEALLHPTSASDWWSPLGVGFVCSAQSDYLLSLPGYSADVFGIDISALYSFRRRNGGLLVSGLTASSDELYGIAVGGTVAGVLQHRQGWSCIYGLALGGLYAGAREVYGMTVGGLYAGAKELHGATLGGLCAYADELHGLSLSGIGTLSGTGSGVMLSGLMNRSGDFSGFQLSALYNGVDSGTVVQIGCVNGAGKATCVQLGLWNYGEDFGDGFPFLRLHW